MAKIDPISGFPEWLPGQRMVEQHFLDKIRYYFELYGFGSIETRSVEPLSQLLRKGETDKEIYVLKRLHAGDDEGHKDLGLHFDLTVPFARYVEQFRGKLVFPLKRYQMQKAWRGERPQEGRYREFYQADIDVVAENNLSLDFDSDLVRILNTILSDLPMPPVTIHINNRKILVGFFLSLGIDNPGDVIREVDKLDKIGAKGLEERLAKHLLLDEDVIGRCLALAQILGRDPGMFEKVLDLAGEGDRTMLQEGVDELSQVLTALADLPEDAFVADMKLARGFDYYTGTVYEGYMLGHESVGAVCSGGRYANLIAAKGNIAYPGIGVSIGISRILGRLLGRDLIQPGRETPSCVLVAIHNEESRADSHRIAGILRKRGIPCEVHHKADKYSKQIRYASRKGMPYVWFPAIDGKSDEVRDIRHGEQGDASLDEWMPAADAREVTFTFTG